MVASIKGALLRGIRISQSTGPTPPSIPDANGGYFEFYDLLSQPAGSPQNVYVGNPTPAGLFWDIVSGSPTLTGTALSMSAGDSLRTQVINCDNGFGYTVFEANYTASGTDSVMVLQSVIGNTTLTLSVYGTTASGLQGKIRLVAQNPNWTTTTYTVTTTGTVDYSGSQIGMMAGSAVVEILVNGVPVAWQELPDETFDSAGNGVFSISITGGSSVYTIEDAKDYQAGDWTDAENGAYTFNETFTGANGTPVVGRYVAGASSSTYWIPSGAPLGYLNGTGGYVADITNPAVLNWINFNVKNVSYSNGFAIESSFTDVTGDAESVFVFYINNTSYTLTVAGVNFTETFPGTIIFAAQNGVDPPFSIASQPLTSPSSVNYSGDSVRVEVQQSGIVVKVNGTPITMYIISTDTVYTGGAIPYTMDFSGAFSNFLVRPDAGVAGSDVITIDYVKVDSL